MLLRWKTVKRPTLRLQRLERCGKPFPCYFHPLWKNRVCVAYPAPRVGGSCGFGFSRHSASQDSSPDGQPGFRSDVFSTISAAHPGGGATSVLRDLLSSCLQRSNCHVKSCHARDVGNIDPASRWEQGLSARATGCEAANLFEIILMTLVQIPWRFDNYRI